MSCMPAVSWIASRVMQNEHLSASVCQRNCPASAGENALQRSLTLPVAIWGRQVLESNMLLLYEQPLQLTIDPSRHEQAAWFQ